MAVVVPLIFIAIFLLLLGEAEDSHLGINTKRLKWQAIWSGLISCWRVGCGRGRLLSASRSLSGYYYEIIFEARNLSVKISAKNLLHEVSVKVSAGEVIALLGANGAGKSTLLKCLCGDTKLSGREMRLEDRRLQE